MNRNRTLHTPGVRHIVVAALSLAVLFVIAVLAWRIPGSGTVSPQTSVLGSPPEASEPLQHAHGGSIREARDKQRAALAPDTAISTIQVVVSTLTTQGQLVEGAKIEFTLDGLGEDYRLAGTTDDNGTLAFDLASATPIWLKVRASSSRWGMSEAAFEVAAATVDARVIFRSTPDISGIVTTLEGLPVQNATVLLARKGRRLGLNEISTALASPNTDFRSTLSDQDGAFSFLGLPPDSIWRLYAGDHGRCSLPERYEARPGTHGINISLEHVSACLIEVMDLGGAPAEFDYRVQTKNGTLSSSSDNRRHIMGLRHPVLALAGVPQAEIARLSHDAFIAAFGTGRSPSAVDMEVSLELPGYEPMQGIAQASPLAGGLRYQRFFLRSLAAERGEVSVHMSNLRFPIDELYVPGWEPRLRLKPADGGGSLFVPFSSLSEGENTLRGIPAGTYSVRLIGLLGSSIYPEEGQSITVSQDKPAVVKYDFAAPASIRFMPPDGEALSYLRITVLTEGLDASGKQRVAGLSSSLAGPDWSAYPIQPGSYRFSVTTETPLRLDSPALTESQAAGYYDVVLEPGEDLVVDMRP